MKMKNFLAAVGLISFALVIQGCKDIEISSRWSDKNIVIDGNDNEWAGSYKFIENEKAAISAKNDNEYLYLVFKTIDQQLIQRVISNGLTIWIDPKSGEEKKFGIHYPVGMMLWNNTQLYDSKDWGTPEEREKRQKEKIKLMLNSLAIISPYGRSEYDFAMTNPFGIQIAINDLNDAIVYEMKIPIISPVNSMYSYNLSDAANLNIGIETGEVDKKEMMPQRSDETMPSGGMGGKGGGMKGSKGGMMGGKSNSMQNMIEPVKFWINLKLAEKK